MSSDPLGRVQLTKPSQPSQASEEIAALSAALGDLHARLAALENAGRSNLLGGVPSQRTLAPATLSARSVYRAAKQGRNFIGADQIAAGAVVAEKIAVAALSAISANVGTLTAGVLRDTASKIKLDLDAQLLTVKDGSGTTRVLLGLVAAGTYGARIYDASGTLVLDETGPLALYDSLRGLLVAGSDVLDNTQQTQNLLGPDAGPDHSFSTGPYHFNGFNGDSAGGGTLISDLGITPGVSYVSFSAEFDVATDGTNNNDAWLSMTFRDSGGTIVGNGGARIDSSAHVTPGETGVRISMTVQVPSNAYEMGAGYRRSGDNTKTGRYAILNVGPKALPYVEPPFRVQRETLSELPNSKLTDSGDLDPTIGVVEGSATSILLRHGELVTVSGPDADGAVGVSFGQAYQNAPAVALSGFTGLAFSSSLGSGVDQRLVLDAQDVTSTGFTAIAQLATGASTSGETDDFASGNALTAVGATAAVTLSASGTYSTSFTLRFDAHVKATSSPEEGGTKQVTVAIDSSADGGTTWVERYTHTYSSSADAGGTNVTIDYDNQSVALSVSGLASGDEFRLRVKSDAATGLGGSYSVHGHNAASDGDTGSGVSYSTTTGGSTASAIPATGDYVKFLATEKA